MWYARLWTSYYVSNVLVLLVYPALRFTVLDNTQAPGPPLPFSFSAARESNIFGTVAVVLAFKLIKSATAEEFLDQAFFFLRLCVLLMLFLLNKVMFAWFLLLLLLVWMLFKHTIYSGPSNFREISSLPDFDSLVLKGSGSCCVLFYAPWSDACLYTMPLWADMSLKYATPRLQFIRINVETAPLIAKKCVLDVGAMSRQLPGLVLYEDGREVIRFPPVDEKGSIPKVMKYRLKEIVDFLGIERRWLASKHEK